jgi:hypothetical protein
VNRELRKLKRVSRGREGPLGDTLPVACEVLAMSRSSARSGAAFVILRRRRA